MGQIMEQMPVVVEALNVGFLQTLKLFFITLIGAFPLGLIIAFGSMSRFLPLSLFSKFVVWIIRGTPLMIQLLIISRGWYCITRSGEAARQDGSWRRRSRLF